MIDKKLEKAKELQTYLKNSQELYKCENKEIIKDCLMWCLKCADLLVELLEEKK